MRARLLDARVPEAVTLKGESKGIPFASEGYKPTIQPEYNQQQCEDEKAAQERLFAACDAHLALGVGAQQKGGGDTKTDGCPNEGAYDHCEILKEGYHVRHEEGSHQHKRANKQPVLPGSGGGGLGRLVDAQGRELQQARAQNLAHEDVANHGVQEHEQAGCLPGGAGGEHVHRVRAHTLPVRAVPRGRYRHVGPEHKHTWRARTARA
eukprot:CAMPEP_0114326744 /NCGR_PEP_ID=MMETSP0059-20121206/29896_1 /TAXON_ID=36894 /ORGANISM="Pyramimonas parkeae, Strain CCMP726" /LENGTH=207 /DNA_ID=CAMNT_0001455755 /DNA_START=398 /DNA_END=1022 /DNA_ORIENTATION=-